MMMRLFLVILLSSLAFGASAYACSCGAAKSIAHEIEKADAVFIGSPLHAGEKQTRFEVIKAIKGVDEDSVMINHWPENGGLSCGVNYKRLDAIVIVAYINKQKDGLWTNACSTAFSTADYLIYLEKDGDYVGLSHECAVVIKMAYDAREFNDGKMEFFDMQHCKAAIEIYDKRFPHHAQD